MLVCVNEDQARRTATTAKPCGLAARQRWAMEISRWWVTKGTSKFLQAGGKQFAVDVGH